MADYRLYFMDRDDRIRRRIDLADCRDDEHAVALVFEHQSHNPMELWQGPRLVKRFEPRAD